MIYLFRIKLSTKYRRMTRKRLVRNDKSYIKVDKLNVTVENIHLHQIDNKIQRNNCFLY